MGGTPQPLVDNQKIVNPDGTPTQYFIRWAQARQNDIQGGVSGSRKIVTPDAGGLAGGGDLSADRTLTANASKILDQLSTTRGTVLYRGVTNWSALAPGTAGEVLTTAGSGADPAWEPPAGGGGFTSYTSYATALWSMASNTGAPLAIQDMEVNFTLASAGNVLVLFDALLIRNNGGAIRAYIYDGSTLLAPPTISSGIPVWYSRAVGENNIQNLNASTVIPLGAGSHDLNIRCVDAQATSQQDFYTRHLTVIPL